MRSSCAAARRSVSGAGGRCRNLRNGTSLSGSGERIRRVVYDSSRVTWSVYEQPTRHVPGAKRERCLIFESPWAVRRAWEYPAAWLTLESDELRRLGKLD